MINYVEKGRWLFGAIDAAGHSLRQIDGAWVADDEVAVQSIIDTFDPLPQAKTEAKARVDDAAGAARARYITVAPGQEAVYTLKKEQAEAYKAAGYPTDASPYPLIEQEATRRNVSAQQVADEILARASQWVSLAAAIEAIRMDAKFSIDAITDSTQWQQCMTIAEAAVTELAAI